MESSRGVGPATICERKLHLGPDEQLVVVGLAPGGGVPHLELRVRRRRPESVDPAGFEDTASVISVPTHLVEVLTDELIKAARRVAEQQIWAPSGSSDV